MTNTNVECVNNMLLERTKILLDDDTYIPDMVAESIAEQSVQEGYINTFKVLTDFGFRPHILNGMSDFGHYNPRNIAEFIIETRFKNECVNGKPGKRNCMEWFDIMGFTEIRSHKLNEISESCGGSFSAFDTAMAHLEGYFDTYLL